MAANDVERRAAITVAGAVIPQALLCAITLAARPLQLKLDLI